MRLEAGMVRGSRSTALMVAVATVLGPGCAGKARKDSSPSGPDAGGDNCAVVSTPPCVFATLRNAKCSIEGCHGTTNPAARLDLASPCIEQRLVDVPSTHEIAPLPDGTPPMCPTDDKLIDTANPTDSWMLIKLNDQQGTCGHGSNVGFAITAPDQACLTDWILSWGT